MKKFAAIFIACLVLAQNIPVFAGSLSTMPTDAGSSERGITKSGQIPHVYNVSDSDFQKRINDRIASVKDSKIEAAERERADSAYFEYEVITSGDYVSVVIYTTLSSSFSSKKEVDSVNFSQATAEFFTITDVLGENAVEIINKYIAATIKQNPENYNPEFRGVSEPLGFYVDGDNCVLLFDQFEIAPGYEEIVTLDIYIPDVRNVYVSGNDYVVIDDTYSVKMMPIRQVCDGLGYTVEWEPYSRDVVISKDNFSTKITVGKNSYQYGANTNRELEAAPELIFGRIYLPISFFGAILGATYMIDDDGNITFSQYKTKF